MTTDDTLRLPIARLSPEAVRRARRRTVADHARQRDLDLVLAGGVRDRGQALGIAARMSARGDQQTTTEAQAIRTLMKRWNITSAAIVETRRRLSGSR